MVRPMAMVISNSSSENPRCFLNFINLFRGGMAPIFKQPFTIPLRLFRQYSKLADGRTDSRSLIASSFIVGRAGRPVKGREANTRTLAFCHLCGYSGHPLMTSHLDLIMTQRRMSAVNPVT